MESPEHHAPDVDRAISAHERSSAAVLARGLLQGIGTRLAHSAAVVAQIQTVLPFLELGWRSAVSDAAWLHDIGHSPEIAATGFHPLDGARWLSDNGWPTDTCRVVAWHTEPWEEGRLRGLEEQLAELDRPPPLVAAALAWADLTSSPSGERWTVERRLADILERYPPDTIVHIDTRAALPALWTAVAQVDALLKNGASGEQPH
jgi:hypothetical protein